MNRTQNEKISQIKIETLVVGIDVLARKPITLEPLITEGLS
jgi:hypothetical protein